MLVWALAGLLGVVLLLAVPVDFVFRIQRRESFRAEVFVGWMYGLLRFRMPSRRPRPPRPKPPKKRAAQVRFARRLMAIFRGAAFRNRLLRFGGDLLKSVRVRACDLRLRMGMDDPADTGYLWAVAGSLTGALAVNPRVSVTLDPSFVAACFEADAQGTVRFIPIQLVYLSVLFLLSPATSGAVWMLVRTRRT